MPAQITLPIVGSQHPNKSPKAPTRLFAIGLCEPGDPVVLRLEPDNPYDEHAIAVDNSQGMMMGYIPANRAVYVGMQIRRGATVAAVRAIFQGKTERSGFIRIAFEGEEPVLPPDPADQTRVDDWQPDPEYPDDWGA